MTPGTRNSELGTRPIILMGGRVLDPSKNRDEVADVAIVNGKMDEIGRGLAENGPPRSGAENAVEIISCEGLVVSPGFIDVHCHLRAPGREEVETIATGAAAAAA